MKNPTVDILLATFNGLPFIVGQLDSLLAQTHRHIHLIIRDDYSKDKTQEILKAYANKFPHLITLLPSETQLGVKNNFSCLMEYSTAPYIMFADQDDIWNEDKVSKTLTKMQSLEKKSPQGTPLLIHTDLKVVDKDLNVLSPSFWSYSGIDIRHAQTFNRLLMQNVVTGCSMMINRSLLQLALPIPEKSAMHDWWLALVAAAFGKIEALSEPTLLYRQHGANTLGAQKFFSLRYLKKGFKKIRSPEIEKHFQAQELYNRYQGHLSDVQKEMLEDYKKLPQVLLPKKVFLIFKNRFFKMGFLRNVINIFFKKQ